MKLALRPGNEQRVRKILGQNKASLALLNRLARGAESNYRSRHGDTEAATGNPGQKADRKSLNRIRKYHRVVSQKFNSYSALVGDNVPTLSGPSAARTPLQLRGRVSAGFGANTATTEVVGTSETDTDVSRLKLAADVTAMLTPSDRLNLTAGHRGEIRFAPTTQTRGALDYTRDFNGRANLGARVGMDQYRNESDDKTDVDRSTVGIRGGIAPSPRLRANADLTRTGASHPNNDGLDYSDTRLTAGAGGTASPTTSWRVDLGHAIHDLEDNTNAEDHTRNNLRGSLAFRTGDRSSMAVVVTGDATKFDADDNPANYSRTGLSLRGSRRGQRGNTANWSLEVRSKGYDVNEDRNHTEFRGEIRSRSGLSSNHESSSSISANYRNFKGKGAAGFLDYIEARWDRRKLRTGILWETNTYAQYFISSDNVDRNAVLNQFAWMGIVLGANHSVIVGPLLATNTDLVTSDGSNLGLFESPANSIRYGVKATARVDAHPVRFTGSGRWEKTEFYNVNNSSAPIRFELEGDFVYIISPRVDASARMKFYTLGADDPGQFKTSEFDLLFGLVYHIGRQ